MSHTAHTYIDIHIHIYIYILYICRCRYYAWLFGSGETQTSPPVPLPQVFAERCLAALSDAHRMLAMALGQLGISWICCYGCAQNCPTLVDPSQKNLCCVTISKVFMHTRKWRNILATLRYLVVCWLVNILIQIRRCKYFQLNIRLFEPYFAAVSQVQLLPCQNTQLFYCFNSILGLLKGTPKNSSV